LTKNKSEYVDIMLLGFIFSFPYYVARCLPLSRPHVLSVSRRGFLGHASAADPRAHAHQGVIQGTFGVIQGTFGVIWGTFSMI
jgi:hypothetical protein